MEAVGEFDESLRMAEDWDYWLRWAKAGVFAYLPGPWVIYRTHDAQVHRNIDRMFAAGKLVLKKHFKGDAPRHRRALASLCMLHAKARWSLSQPGKTGMLLASAAFHNKMARAAGLLKRPV
jgi:hypothetical protein